MSIHQQFFCPECGAEGTLDVKYESWRRVQDPQVGSEYGRLRLHWNIEEDQEEQCRGYRCSSCNKDLSEEQVIKSVKTKTNNVTVSHNPESAVFYITRGWLHTLHNTKESNGTTAYDSLKQSFMCTMTENFILDQFLIPISREFVRYVLANVDLNIDNGFWQYELESEATPIMATWDAETIRHMLGLNTDNTEMFAKVIKEIGWNFIKDRK